MMNSPSCWRLRKDYRGRDRGYRVGAAMLECFSRQKLLDNERGVGRRVIVVRDLAGRDDFGLQTENAIPQSLQDSNIVQADIENIEKNGQHSPHFSTHC